MQSLQKIEGESRVFRVALWLTFCAAVLAGCSTTQPRLVSPAPLLPSGSPRTAVSFLARRPAKPFIPPPAVTNITLQWLNDNTGNTNVVTGIVKGPHVGKIAALRAGFPFGPAHPFFDLNDGHVMGGLVCPASGEFGERVAKGPKIPIRTPGAGLGEQELIHQLNDGGGVGCIRWRGSVQGAKFPSAHLRLRQVLQLASDLTKRNPNAVRLSDRFYVRRVRQTL